MRVSRRNREEKKERGKEGGGSGERENGRNEENGVEKFARVKGDFVVLFARLNIRRSWNQSRLKAPGAGIIIIKRRASISTTVPPATFTISSDNPNTEDLLTSAPTLR